MTKWWKRTQSNGSSRLLAEYASWFLVNCLICQLPLLFMWINAADSSSIFSNFLSYVFTFLISSYYALMSLKHDSFKDGWNNVYGWLAVIYLLIIFGILSVYPDIKNYKVRSILVDRPLMSYVFLLAISIFLSWKLCVPALTEKLRKIVEEKESTKKFRQAEAMRPGVIIDALEGDDNDEE